MRPRRARLGCAPRSISGMWRTPCFNEAEARAPRMQGGDRAGDKRRDIRSPHPSPSGRLLPLAFPPVQGNSGRDRLPAMRSSKGQMSNAATQRGYVPYLLCRQLFSGGAARPSHLDGFKRKFCHEAAWISNARDLAKLRKGDVYFYRQIFRDKKICRSARTRFAANPSRFARANLASAAIHLSSCTE